MTSRQIEILKREIETARDLAAMYDKTGRVFLAAGNRAKAYERRNLAAMEYRKADLLTRQLAASGVKL